MTEAIGTEVATLPPAERALIALGSSKAEEQIREIIKESAEITVVTDKTGRELAHRVGMKLKTTRTSIEKIGKAAREDAQAFSKAVIDEEKRLKGLMSDEENRIFKLRDDFDTKEREEKEAKERAERERVTAIRVRIDAIRALPLQSANDKAGEIELTLADLKAMSITEEEYAEFTMEAANARHEVMGELRTLADSVRSREEAEAAVAAEKARLKEEADRLAAERAELERMRAELEAKLAAAAPATLFSAGLSDDEIISVQTTHSAIVVMEDQFGANTTIQPDEDEKNIAARSMLDAVNLVETSNADQIVDAISGYTAMQFNALADKVRAIAGEFHPFADELSAIAYSLSIGNHNEKIKAGNWFDMANADKKISGAAHACVALVFGDNAEEVAA